MQKQKVERASYAVRLPPEIRKRLKEYCQKRGIKQAYFVEQALREKLEREEALEDSLEFKRWKHEEGLAVDFEKYLEKRG